MIVCLSEFHFNEADMVRICEKYHMEYYRVLGVVGSTIEVAKTKIPKRQATQEWFEHTLDEACRILSENPNIGLGVNSIN